MQPEKALKTLDNLCSETFSPINEARKVIAELLHIAYIEGRMSQQRADSTFVHRMFHDIREGLAR